MYMSLEMFNSDSREEIQKCAFCEKKAICKRGGDNLCQDCHDSEYDPVMNNPCVDPEDEDR
jgi:hypothetical protein